jgi:hypothetical protein
MTPSSEITLEELAAELAAIRAVQAWRREQRESALLTAAIATGMTAAS